MSIRFHCIHTIQNVLAPDCHGGGTDDNSSYATNVSNLSDLSSASGGWPPFSKYCCMATFIGGGKYSTLGVRACAARVTILGLCVSVCFSVAILTLEATTQPISDTNRFRTNKSPFLNRLCSRDLENISKKPILYIDQGGRREGGREGGRGGRKKGREGGIDAGRTAIVWMRAQCVKI